ncbi:2'-5' RNA ligase family protein [Streptomyces phytophilus]|uniref:2'-5' RNA ligase family protein n=1 Tax=Streptomyces phytophilus TaxID=722715 RepID=UPI0015F07A9E|nr:hypothetical protein [Streptomyces phytophilus]
MRNTKSADGTEGNIVKDFFDAVESREHAWPAGREDLHWHLLPQPSVSQALTEGYQAAASLPGMAPVAPEWIHITVQHGAPMAAYREGEVEAIKTGVAERARAMQPVEVTLARPAFGTVALECGGHPGEPARRVWEMACAVHEEVTGHRFPRIPALSYPHASLAYGTSQAPLLNRAQAKVVLSDLPGDPVALRLDTLTLVAQSHDRRYITWRELASVKLGGA